MWPLITGWALVMALTQAICELVKIFINICRFLIMNNNKLDIVAFSDNHGYLPPIEEFPEKFDVLCICGDIVPVDAQKDMVKSLSWFLLDFIPWVEKVPCDKVLLVAGNHDFFLEALGTYVPEIENRLFWGKNYKKITKKLKYLCDSSYQYKGFSFYGTPWCPELSRWAFYKDSEGLVKAFGDIPKKLDVLLTHTPPKIGGVGMVLQGGLYRTGTDYGCKELTEALTIVNCKYALCGHVHSGAHCETECNGKKFVNVSLLDEDYRLKYDMYRFTLEK